MERKWLISARKKKGLTQEAVAKNIGVTRQSYMRYETGERNPRPETAARIEDVLAVRKEDFFWQ